MSSINVATVFHSSYSADVISMTAAILLLRNYQHTGEIVFKVRSAMKLEKHWFFFALKFFFAVHKF